MNCPRSPRDLVEILKAHGATRIRTVGDHEQWRLPNGRTFPVQLGKAAWSDRRQVMNRWRDLTRMMPELRRHEETR